MDFGSFGVEEINNQEEEFKKGRNLQSKSEIKKGENYNFSNFYFSFF
jgi:hypothetical protein